MGLGKSKPKQQKANGSSEANKRGSLSTPVLSAWESGKRERNHQKTRSPSPVINKLKDPDEESFGQTTYNLLDLHGTATVHDDFKYSARNNYIINNNHAVGKRTPKIYSPPPNDKYENFRSSPKKRSSADEVDRSRRAFPTIRSPSPPPAAPKRYSKRAVDDRRVSDVSTIELSPSPMRRIPVKSNSFNHKRLVAEFRQQQQPPPPPRSNLPVASRRRARSISPPPSTTRRRPTPPQRVEPYPREQATGPAPRKRTFTMPPKSNAPSKKSNFTSLGQARRASQSMDSSGSAVSNFAERTKVQPFNDARDSLASAGLSSIKALKNHFQDQKVIGMPSFEKARNDMQSDDWEKEMAGLQMMVSIARSRPDVLKADMKQVVALMLGQLKNLRSQVCRTAGQAYAELFFHLGKEMELDLDKSVSLLLQKAADTNKFIRESCKDALDTMMENVTVLRAMQSVLDTGEKHKSGVVRAEAARLVDLVVTRLGAERVMGCSKEMKALLVKRASRLLSDPSPDARKFSRHAFAELNTHKAFDALLMQMLGENERRDVRKALGSKT